MCCSRGAFPAALDTVQDWLQSIDRPYYVIHLLIQSELTKKFPEEALELLNVVVVKATGDLFDLESCLEGIVQALPSLVEDFRYKRLKTLVE